MALLSLSSAFAQFPRATGEIVAPAPAKKPAKQNQVTPPPKNPSQVSTPAKQGTAVASTKTRRGKPSAQKSGQKLVEDPLVAPLPTPTTLAQMPPVAPKVTFAGGQLTIDAPNSRLSDVISAVRRATGTTFEGATSDERVAVKLGPGASRDVITALLHGSRLDYIIVAADKDPSQAQRVLLMQSSGGGPQPGTVAQGPPRPNQPVNQGDPDMGDEPTNTDEIPDQTVTEPPPSNTNNAEIENQNNQQNQQENNQNQQQQPKTPEQLLQELQQLQQQQQQQIQQMQQNNPNNQNQPNQNPPQ